MKILNIAISGTLESSDVQVTVEPAQDSITVDISSNVLNQYGKQIKRVVLDTLERLGVSSARVTVVDKGALDCTIRARVENAVFRAAGHNEAVDWGGLVRE